MTGRAAAQRAYDRRVSATTRFWEDATIVARYGALDDLFEEESLILERLRGSLAAMRMLDIGVGAGRTTAHFAPLAGRYVGCDYSQPMILACRKRFAHENWPHARFEVADVRAMPQLASGSFDFVLFSYNGLDYLLGEPADRRHALEEIRRVCAPGAVFALSTHNLNDGLEELSFQASLARSRREAERGGGRYLPAARAVARTAMLRLLNVRSRRPRDADRATLYDHRLRLRPMRTAYIRPAEQLRELARAGFADACALTGDGRELRDEREVDALDSEWVHYLAWNVG